MKIPFGTVTLNKKSKDLVRRILQTGRISSGRYVREFEKRFADLVGTKEAVATSSGTDALALSLAVLYDYGARRQDEIIMPALSFMATANAVFQAGFRPVFVDIEKETLNIDVSRIERVITKDTKAILPVHLMGKPAQMDKIMDIARKHKLFTIGDAAEAHGAVYKGTNVGALGDMAGYSLYVAHIITTVEGGIITTDNAGFAGVIRSLRSHGRMCSCASCLLNINSAYCPKRFDNPENEDIRFMFERIGFSAKMNELEAAIGIGNLDSFNKILGRRRENLLYLIKKFRGFEPLLFTIKEESCEKIGPHAFPFVVGETAQFKRNQLMSFLQKKGIDTRTLFCSIPTQCKGLEFLGYKSGDFPNAEYVGENGLHIGVHQDIGRQECDYFIKTVDRFLRKKD